MTPNDKPRDSWLIPLFTAGAIVLWVLGILALLDWASGR